MATRQTPKTGTCGFEVMIHQSLGRVEFDIDSEHSPIEAAFLMIAGDHQDRNGQDAEYSFPGPDEGQVIHVNVQTSNGNPTKGYFN